MCRGVFNVINVNLKPTFNIFFNVIVKRETRMVPQSTSIEYRPDTRPKNLCSYTPFAALVCLSKILVLKPRINVYPSDSRALSGFWKHGTQKFNFIKVSLTLELTLYLKIQSPSYLIKIFNSQYECIYEFLNTGRKFLCIGRVVDNPSKIYFWNKFPPAIWKCIIYTCLLILTMQPRMNLKLFPRRR